MSVQNVRTAIERFLASSEPQVLCIRGAWGTGKTYSWKDVAEKQRDKRDGIALKQYAYVSLFGLNSIQEMKVQIVQNTTTTAKIGEFINEETLRDALDKAEGPTKKAAMWLLQAVMGNRFESAIAAMSAMISKQIVVFDDLERKGAKLSNADVFGFASYLKEERKCKIVLLLNDEKLNEADKATFNSYLEKVVDISLLFDPTKDEIADIAVTGTSEVDALVKKHSKALGINNVRVIRKILALVKDVEPMLAPYSPVVTQNAAAVMTLLGWSYFQPEIAPPLDYLKRVHTYSPRKEDEALDLKWRDTLLAYRYSHTSEFDLLLLKGIENGYFEKEEIEKHAADLHRADERDKVEQEQRLIWDDLHYSFTIPAEDLLDRFHAHYVKNIAFMTLGDMVILERLFRELGDNRNMALVDLYIAQNKDNPNAFDFDRLERFGQELSEEVRGKVNAAIAAQKPKLSSDEVLIALHGRGHEEAIYDAASKIPVEEYVRILKSHEKPELGYIISGLRQYLTLGNPDPRILLIMDKAGGALRVIAAESPINKRRAMRLGLIQRLDEIEAKQASLAAEQGAAEAAAAEHAEQDEQTVG